MRQFRVRLRFICVLFFSVFVTLNLIVTFHNYNSGIIFVNASVNYQNLYPPNNAQTLDTTPVFKCTPISNVSAYVNVTLYVDDVASGTVFNHPNNTECAISCNHTLTVSDTKIPWYFNITDADGTYSTETRYIGIGAYFKVPAVLLNPNATNEHWTYYLNGSITDSSFSKAVQIFDNNITLNGQNNTLDGTDTHGTQAINLERQSSTKTNITILNITLSDWYIGIYLRYVRSNTIRDLAVSSCSFWNIMYSYATYNQAINVNVTGGKGIYLDDSHHNDFFDVTVKNCNYGFECYNSGYVAIINSTIHNNNIGFLGTYVSGFTFENVTAYSNSNRAFYIKHTTSGTLTRCWLENNGYGIVLEQTSGLSIYNNLFNNSVNVGFDGSMTNNWNVSKQEGERIYSNGTYIGGNFWAKPDGTGASQVGQDGDGDGFLDTPVQIDPNNYDYLPYSLLCGKILKIRLIDSKSNVISNGVVTINNGTEHTKQLISGWANWTGQTYKNTVFISVTFQDVQVNTTSVLMNGEQGVFTVKCKVYSLTVKLIDVAGNPVVNMPLELYRNNTLINGMFNLPSQPKTNASGMFTWEQLAYQTASYTVVVPGLVSRTITLTNNTVLTLSVPSPVLPQPQPSPVPKPSPKQIAYLRYFLAVFLTTVLVLAYTLATKKK